MLVQQEVMVQIEIHHRTLRSRTICLDVAMTLMIGNEPRSHEAKTDMP